MRLHRVAFLFLGITGAFAIDATPWPSGPIADLKFETSVFMAGTAYSNPSSLSPDAAPSGAYGPFNREFDQGKGSVWYIESQRFGFDIIGAGLALHQKPLINKGLHIFDWGFKHQSADGSFDCPDPFHSTAFFLEAVARTALLLQASEFKNDYAPWIESVKPKLHAAARWMATPHVEKAGMLRDSPYTHRFYLDADALGFVGLLSEDSELVAKSVELVKEGLSKQSPEGFNPEKGGSDTSYHCVGLVFALRYYSILADSDLRQSLGLMISKGIGWLNARLRPDGSVDQSGNTRTGSGQETGRDKKLKTMSYYSAFRAFEYWSQIVSDPSLDQAAYKLYTYGKTHEH